MALFARNETIRKMEKLITLSPQNIATEHICCAFSDKKAAEGYEAKKRWISDKFNEGFTFKKFDIRGKVFIEYVPAENAWCPIVASDYLFIDCFWVSGQYKGKGYGKALLQECFADATDKNGVVALTSDKKRPFLNDRKFLEMQGFEKCDSAPPYFELWYKPFKDDAPIPQFKDCVRNAECDSKNGLTIYYSNSCPFTEYYVAEVEVVAAEKGFAVKTIKIDTKEQAQRHWVPFTKYSVFRDGKFVTHQILNEGYFNKFIHS